MNDHKTALTFEEKIKAAYLHYVRGVDQQDLATAFEVNSGRVNEACKIIKEALIPPEQDK
jgi:DNA-binding transcriptional regulator LsrR (DeoR family)